MAEPRADGSTSRKPCELPSEKSTSSFWHSEPSPLLTGHQSTRKLPMEADVVIIGSGMTGASVAYHILNQPKYDQLASGPSVVMLEAREACWGATGRNGGHCQPVFWEHPHDPSIGHFELANFHTLQFLIEEKSIDCEFVTQPAVRAIYDHRHLTDIELAIHAVQQNAPDLAKRMRLVTKRKDLENLRIPTAVGAVVTNIAARMWPYKFVSKILEELLTSTELNGTFNLQTLTPVKACVPYDKSDRWWVQTPRGAIIASKVVLATNGYTSHLLPAFADLIVPCRGQMSALNPFPSVSGELRLKTSFGFLGDGLDDYLIQRPNDRGGHLMFGGGRQHGPSIGVADDSTIDDRTAEYLRGRLVEVLGISEGKSETGKTKQLCRYCEQHPYPPQARSFCNLCAHLSNEQNVAKPEPTAKEFRAAYQWTGIMGFSRDELPWIGPVPDTTNLYMAAGYTGHGMPSTWLCGKALALMVKNSLGIPTSGLESTGLVQQSGNPINPRIIEEGIFTRGAVLSAVKEVGLPMSYLATKERMVRAMNLESVEAQDWSETDRARRRNGDRPHSGYA